MVRPSPEIKYFSITESLDATDLDFFRVATEKVIACDIASAMSEMQILAAYNQASILYGQTGRRYRDLRSLFILFLTGKKQIKEASKIANLSPESKACFLIFLDIKVYENIFLQSVPSKKMLPILRPIPAENPEYDEPFFWRMNQITLQI